MEYDAYIRTVCDFLERLPSHIVIQRVASDVPLEMLLTPPWAGEKQKIVRDIEKELARRDTWQGRLCI